MKDRQKADIDDMIMGAHYLDALEKEAQASKPLSDMERQDYIDQIQTLRDFNEQLKGTISCLTTSLESSDKKNASLEVQICNFQTQVSHLQKIISDLTGEISSLREEVAKLNDRNNRHNQMIFGKKSQKSSSRHDEAKSREEEQMDCDNSGKYDDKSDDDADTDGGKESPLNREKVKSEYLDGERGERGSYTTMDAAKIITLKTSLKGHPDNMKFIGFKPVDEFNKISYVECTRFIVAIYEDEFGVRHEYYNPEESEDTRRPHLNVISGTHCTPEFLADLVSDRYLLHTPNYREGSRMLIDKFQSSDSCRSNWLKYGASMLRPMCDYLKVKLLKIKSVLNIDETWCRVRIKFKEDGTKLGKYFKKYIWVIVNKIENIVYFLYDNEENDSRGQRPIMEFLGSFQGSVQSDGYVVYEHLANENPNIEHILCWAHVRAKYKYAADFSKDKNAEWFVETIGRLYMIEVENRILHRTAEEIKERRSQDDVTSILTSLYNRAIRMLKDSRHHYGDMMERALKYMINGWDELLNYRNDGRYGIDNLEAERSIRPFTINRKNSLFFGSEEGIEVATTYLTIIETVKKYGLDIKDYLTNAFREVMRGNQDCSTYAPEALVK